MPNPPRPRRRSGLLQERSRETRRRLIRAALDLWSERGYRTGIEETSVDEIAAAAGVTKGTFYFHFARKEQILLEMGLSLAAEVYEEARAGLEGGRDTDELLARLLGLIATRVRAAPREAVGRVVAEFQRMPRTGQHVAFLDAFAAVFSRARDQGEVVSDLDPEEMGQMLEALVMDSILDWAVGAVTNLPTVLRNRSTLLLAGLRPEPALT